jgi:Mrp family chromosome partitioning ATPase
LGSLFLKIGVTWASFSLSEKQLFSIDKFTSALSTADIKDVSVNIETKIAKYSTQKGVEILPEVKNIIAVASGKGG